jgi:hypothetical protein
MNSFLKILTVSFIILILAGCPGRKDTVSEETGSASSGSTRSASAEDIPEGMRIITPEDPWAASLDSLDIEPGESFAMELPPGGSGYSIWGTYVYSGDSSIGTAAVHAGLLTYEEGGFVIVEVMEGRDYYLGSVMNTVESGSYQRWGRSYTFLHDGQRIYPDDYNEISWDTAANIFPAGVEITLVLPPGGSDRSIWGTDVYTNDSPIGTAAVHMGLITFEDGGEVTIKCTERTGSYEGSERNGVVSQDYEAWPGAYVFVK